MARIVKVKINHVGVKWEQVTLGDVCEIIAGQSPKSSNYNDSRDGLPFYQGKKEFTDKYLGTPTKWTTQVTSEAIARDILMSVRAPVGPINFATKRICIGRGLVAIRTGEQIDREFLFYLLLSMQGEIKGSEGAVFASINKNQIQCISFSKPPLAEQKRIVATLDEAFAAIETATANTAKNLTNARELFESQLERAFTVDAVSEGWTVRSLGEVCLIQPPKREAKARLKLDDKVSFVPMKSLGIRQKDFDSTRTKLLSEVYGSYTCFVERDVLLAKITPCFQNGKLGIAHNLKNGIGFGSSEFFVFRCLNQLIPEYLFYFLSQQSFTDAGVTRMSGAVGQQRVPPKFVHNYSIPVPPFPEQKHIVEMLDKLSAEKQSLVSVYEAKIKALNELKQSLLHKAFTGELTADTKAADRTLSEAGI